MNDRIIRASQLSRRDMLRGIGAGAALLGGGGLLAACGSSGSTTGAKATGSAAAAPSGRSGTLQAAISAEPNFINPADALELYEYAVVRSVYDGLTQWSPAYTRSSPRSRCPGPPMRTPPSGSSSCARA